MIKNLTTATPSEIDTALAEIYGRMVSPEQRLDHTLVSLARTGIRALSDRDRARFEASAESLQAEVDALLLEAAPLEDEYVARGRWTRAFLCLAAGGHVHSSQACSTTFRTTSFGWLPQVSGHDEVEIVAASGADACTVCYPTAPVESLSRPRTLLHLSEVDAQARRDALAARKAEIADKRAAKALEIDLRPMGVDGYIGQIHTLSAAKTYLTDAAEYAKWGRSHPYYPITAVAHVAEHVAAKVGTNAWQEMDAAAKRAAKRR